MPIDIIGYVNILIGIINVFLGVVVLRSNSKKLVNRAYFYCTLTIGIWSLCLYFYDREILLNSVLWLKIVYVIAYLMTISQINFALKLYGDVAKGFSKIFFSILALSFVYGLYLLFIDNSVVLSTSYDMQSKTVIAQMGSTYVLYFTPILISLVFLFYRHITRGQKQVGIKKKQAQFYWIAGFCMILPLVFLDFVLPVFYENTMYYKYGTLGNILWTIIIAYSIYNTRFLEVRLVLGRLVEFFFKSFYILLLLGLFYFVIQESTLFNNTNILVSLILISLLATILLSFLNIKTETLIQKKFIYSKYNPVEELQKYSSSNSEELKIEKILENTTTSIMDSFNPRGCTILLFKAKSNEIVFQASKKFNALTNDVISSFISNWENLNSSPVLIFSEIETKYSSGKEIIDKRKEEILSFMSQYGIEIIIPLGFKSEVRGILLLGEKIDNSLYSAGDISFLEGIIRNANIALGRALLYKQLQSFNITLQEKVNDQTKELQIKVKQLEEARKKENDMIDIMGHELRTPATVVKLNVTLLEKYIKSNPAEFKKYLDRIRQAVETEIGLINTLLTSAKLEGKKIEIKKEKVDIKEEISMSIHGHEQELSQRKISLESNIDKGVEYVYADRVRVAEVLNNLISNAIKYTDKGKITVSAKSDGKNVIVSVQDTGKGIPKEDVPRLGGKFFRIDNYLESDIVRPGGTGLGLYITFRLVRLMGGDIKVNSEIGKGSIFTFTLPVYRGQQIETIDSIDRFKKLGLKK